MYRYFFILLLSALSVHAGNNPDPEADSPQDDKKLSQYREEFYRFNGNDFPKAVAAGNKALLLARKLNRTGVEAEMWLRVGQAEYSRGDHEKALGCYINSARLYQGLNSKAEVAGVYNEIAVLHRKNNDIEKSKEFIRDAMQLYLQATDTNGLATTYNNMGITSEVENKPQQALKYYRMALDLYIRIRCELCISYCFDYMAGAFSLQQHLDSALVYAERSLALRKKINNKYMLVQSLNSVGEIYFRKKSYSQSLRYFKEGARLAREIHFPDYEKMAYDFLARAYEKTGDYRQAYLYHSRYMVLSDSLFNISRAAKISELQTRYESQEKESKIRLLQQAEKISRLTMKEQQEQILKRNYLLGGGSLLFLLALAAAYAFNSRKNLNNRLARAEAVKAAENSERLRIATDIHDELGSGLSKISFLSGVIYSKPAEAGANLASIAETSNNLILNMRDMIWALNPENTTLDNLIASMREYSTDFLEDFPLELKSSYPDEIESCRIQKEAHRHIFLTLKEALHNIVKHAEATKVEINVGLEKHLCVSISDNGKGFTALSTEEGNGLKNMRHRIGRAGGELIINSRRGEGTSLTITVPLDKLKLVS